MSHFAKSLRTQAFYKANGEVSILGERAADRIEAADELAAVLDEAVEKYGKPGGPWNVPSEPGSWIAKARTALAKYRTLTKERQSKT